MKLGILIYSLSGGGAERAVSYLLSYCKEKKINVVLFLMSSTIQYDIPEETEIHYIENSNPKESGILKTIKIPFLAYKYSRLLKKHRITHSLSFLTRPSLINILSSKTTTYKYKVITNERAFPSLQYSYKGFQSTFNKWMIKTLYKKSDIVISNSQGNAKDLIDNFDVPSKKMRVINNPIDLNKINSIKPIENFFDNSAFNIITLGRLTVGKNHKMLIEAINNLNNKNIKLYIFGQGNLNDELELLISKLNLQKQVFLIGFESNPYQYLKSSDLFIFGSNHEGFPNVLLEAMACGIPILTTNCKSGPSEIMHLKTEKDDDIMKTDYGILVPIKSTELMAKGLSYFINNKKFLEKCKVNVSVRVNDFKKDNILSKYIDVVNSLN